ncbi:MAG: hypothetical protein IPL31_01650 [Saprospiraceae bacterium]|nr:hypothetical protein [Saprospiraceae bacterium]
MKLLKRKKYWLIVNLLFVLFACNHHAMDKPSSTQGRKDPVIGKPTNKDSIMHRIPKAGSPNEEYDQHRIDSIKRTKIKPR